MKAGRELDALVAEKVMGWTGLRDGFSNPFYVIGRPPIDDETDILLAEAGIKVMVPEYSTDIAAAWEVLEKMRRTERAIYVNFVDKLIDRLDADQDEAFAAVSRVLYALTAEAICLAALRTKGIDVDEAA